MLKPEDHMWPPRCYSDSITSSLVWFGQVRSKVLGIGVMPSDRQLLYSLALPAAADFSQFGPTARLVFAVRIMRGIVCTRMSFLAEGNRAGGI
jgi:hypothetical protein